MATTRQDSKWTSCVRTLLPLVVAALAAQGCAHKGDTKSETPSQPAQQHPQAGPESAAPPPPPLIEQAALDRLRQMSESLASARTFTYKARSSAEFPAKTGQFLTFFADSEVAVRRPDKLQAKVGGDLPHFRLYYDGSSVSAFDPEKNLYATGNAPATIDEVLPFMIDKTGINFPAADFLYSNPYSVLTRDLTHAIVVGPAQVGGIPCDHFAYMSPKVNWEIWIEKGKSSLPRRLALTYKDVQNFPRFQVEFSDWNLTPKIDTKLFQFEKPAGAKRVEFGSQLPDVKK